MVACAPAEEVAKTPTPKASPPAVTTPSPTAEATPTPAADATTEFVRQFKGFEAATFKVKYRADIKMEEEQITGSMTWALKPPKFRMDIDAQMKGQPFTATFIFARDVAYFCGAQEGEKSCLKMPIPQVEGQVEPFRAAVEGPAKEIEKEPGRFRVSKAGGRAIAGARATCWKFIDRREKVEGEVCLSREGVPLFMRFQGPGGQGTLEATEYSTKVSDAEFEPPYPVRELPGLPPGLPTGFPGLPTPPGP